MAFLNGILLFGAAAFTIPLIIHLLNRSRFRTIDWGAMHLLETVLRANQRRFRLEQWLLLLIRCAIPVLLAICLARPVLTTWQSLQGGGSASTVILLDTSYSMNTVREGRSAFEAAVDHACAVVAALPRGSDVAVVTTGGSPAPVFDTPIFDGRTMIQQLRMLRGGFGPSDVARSLETGSAILAGMANPRRDLVWISDFQQRDWEALTKESRERWKRLRYAGPLPSTLTLMPVGKDAAENVAVQSLRFSETVFGTDQDLPVRAELRNYGSKDYPNLRVVLRLDGVQQSVSEVSVRPQSTTQAALPCQIKTPGSHVLEIEMQVEDVLAADNRFTAVCLVLDQTPVLLVDGSPSTDPLASETDFLCVALTPFTLGREARQDVIETKTIRVPELTSEAIAKCRVVVLANVPRTNDAQLELLRQFVTEGGSLLCFLGDKVDLDWYRSRLCSGNDPLLPLVLDSLAGSLEANSTAARILAEQFDHPGLAIFNDRTHGNLADAEIRRWYRLAAPKDPSGPGASDSTRPRGAETTAAPTVPARLDTGDPLLAEKRVGRGFVLQVATACDADWSNLPMRPFYVPLMQQLVTSMVSRAAPPRNVKTGETLVAILPAEAEGTPLTLASPDESLQTLRPVRRGTVCAAAWDQTRQPGIYTLTGADRRNEHYAAETPRTESDLRLLDAKQIQSLSDELDADVVRSGEEYSALTERRRQGRDVGSLVLLALMGLLAGELILQQRFAKVRT